MKALIVSNSSNEVARRACNLCNRKILAGQAVVTDFDSKASFGRRHRTWHTSCMARLLDSAPQGIPAGADAGAGAALIAEIEEFQREHATTCQKDP